MPNKSDNEMLIVGVAIDYYTDFQTLALLLACS